MHRQDCFPPEAECLGFVSRVKLKNTSRVRTTNYWVRGSNSCLDLVHLVEEVLIGLGRDMTLTVHDCPVRWKTSSFVDLRVNPTPA